MNVSYFLKDNAGWFKEWCRKNFGPKDYLTVQRVWDSSVAPAAGLFINGEERQYGVPIAMDKGAFTIKATCNSGGDRFRRFSTEDASVDHSAYEYETTMDFAGTTEISAFFSTQWS